LPTLGALLRGKVEHRCVCQREHDIWCILLSFLPFSPC
jgi:hypothetical protein